MKSYLKVGALLCMALLALLVAPGAGRAQGSQEVTLTMTEFSISPASFTVTQGQPVHFTIKNAGKFPHTVTFMKDAEMMTLTAQPLKGGESATADFTFDKAGTWNMHCPVDSHADKGMVGEVVVMDATSPGMPSTGQPFDQSPLLLGGLLGLTLLAGGLALGYRKAKRAA